MCRVELAGILQMDKDSAIRFLEDCACDFSTTLVSASLSVQEMRTTLERFLTTYYGYINRHALDRMTQTFTFEGK